LRTLRARARSNSLLLCPPHSTTSPKSTSFSAKASPVEHEKEICCGEAVAGCAGRLWRQTPSAPVGVVYFCAWKVVVTLVPGGAKPKTMAGCGPRCSTMWSPKTLESAQGTAAAAPAASAAVAARRSILVRWAAAAGGG
jgi:hypothetical protein